MVGSEARADECEACEAPRTLIVELVASRCASAEHKAKREGWWETTAAARPASECHEVVAI